MKRISTTQLTAIWMSFVLMMAPTIALANTATYNFQGSFVDYSSLAAGEYAMVSQAAAKVCPSYGNWSDSIKPFDYTHTYFDDIWNDYSANPVYFSITCNWQSVNHTFSGAYFVNYGSIQDGLNAIQNDLWEQDCGGGNHQLTNMHFNSFYWTETYFDGIWHDYSATGISGSYTCET